MSKQFRQMLILIAGIRKRILYWFNKSYVLNSLAMRKGQCNHCGSCCRDWDLCPHFHFPDCDLYGTKKFFWCKIAPIDEFEQKLEGIDKICGYYWK